MKVFEKIKDYIKSDCKNCIYYKDKTKWYMCKVVRDIDGKLKCVNKEKKL